MKIKFIFKKCAAWILGNELKAVFYFILLWKFILDFELIIQLTNSEWYGAFSILSNT